MWISELHVTAFGKLINKDLKLDRGFNIIKGGNETGKSTLHAFIFAMLFGAERSRGRASKDELYTRYKPRTMPGSFAGSIVFEHEGVTYRLERVFLHSEKSVKLYREDTGAPVPLPDGTISSLIPEMTASAYRNTMSVMSRQAEPDVSVRRDVTGRIAGIGYGGDSSIDVTGALKDLKAKRKELGIQGLEEELERSTEELSYQEKLAERMGAVGARIAGLEEETGEIASRLKEEEEAYQEALLANDPSPGEKPETIGMSGELQGDDGDPDRAEETPEEDEAGAWKRRKDRLYLASVITMALGLVILLISNERFAIGVGIGVAALAASVILFAVAVVVGKMRPTEKTEEPVSTDAEKLKHDYIKLSERRSMLLARSEEIRHELIPLYGEVSVLSEKEKPINECQRAVREAKKALEEAEKADRAIGFAIDSIEELARDMHTHFDRMVSERLTGYLQAFTAGNHGKATVDDNLSISVWDGETIVSPEQLSTGARDQTELAFRLAVADVFFKGKNMPLVMDEVFESFDDERLASTVDMILENFDNQVILFTCHDREEKILGEAAHVIEL